MVFQLLLSLDGYVLAANESVYHDKVQQVGILVIGKEAFYDCKLLNEVHIPDTIDTIEESAFENCNITQFRIPPLLPMLTSVFWRRIHAWSHGNFLKMPVQ